MNTFRKNILVIEDEPDIAELIEFNLENNKYRTSIAYNGETGLEQARKNNPDLILLDLMLPGIHGLDVCRILKADNQLKNTSVIILSALGQEDNIVKGLEAGADDYITKPFSLKVLLARIEAVLRRDKETENNQSKTLLIHDILIIPKEREVKVGENKIDLTFTEFQILHLLSSAEGSLLDDPTLVDVLQVSKTTSNEVTEQLEIAEETEIQIDAARQGYRPISVRAALLYFILSDLAAVDPMYQFSLQAYVTLFLQSITNSRDKSGIVPELPLRLREIIDFHTLQVYKTTCLGLFERHKLLLSFQMCTKILLKDSKIPKPEFKF